MVGIWNNPMACVASLMKDSEALYMRLLASELLFPSLKSEGKMSTRKNTAGLIDPSV